MFLKPPASRHGIGVAALVGVVVLTQAAFFGYHQFAEAVAIQEGKLLTKKLMDPVMKRHLAEGLGAAIGKEQARVICEPDLAPALYYFGGIGAVSSFYWENLEGLHDATAFLTDRGDATAGQVARQRGLSYLILSHSQMAPAQFNYIKTGSMEPIGAGTTLLMRLNSGFGTPSWITLDRDLTRIGRRDFIFKHPHGELTIQSLWTVYSLNFTNPAARGPAQRVSMPQ